MTRTRVFVLVAMSLTVAACVAKQSLSAVNPAAPGFNTSNDPLKTFQNVSLAQDLSGLQMSRAPNFTGT